MPWNQAPPDFRFKLDDLATPDDNKDLNATILRHGLMPKLSGDANTFLNGLGDWMASGDSGGSSVFLSADSLWTLFDDLTPTKLLQFQLDGLDAGLHTFRPPPSAAASTLTLAAIDLAQTFTESQTVDGSSLATTLYPLTATNSQNTTVKTLRLQNLSLGASAAMRGPEWVMRNAAGDTNLEWWFEISTGDTPNLELWNANRPDGGGTAFYNPLIISYAGAGATFSVPVVIDNITASHVLLKLVPHASQSADILQIRNASDTGSITWIDSAGQLNTQGTLTTLGTDGTSQTVKINAVGGAGAYQGGFGLVLDDGAGFLGELQTTGALSADRAWAFPNQSGTMLMNPNPFLSGATVASFFYSDTLTSGARFADVNSIGKALRFVLSGIPANTNNAMFFTSSAARMWGFPDYNGNVLMEAGIVNLIGQTASIGSTTIFTPPSYVAPFTVASCTTTTGASARIVTSSAGFGSVTSGMAITGTGIPINTYVTNKTSSSSIGISQAATIANTVTMTFSIVSMYQVSAYMICTTLGDSTDKVDLNLAWNDGVSAQTYTSFISLDAHTAVNARAQGTFNIIANASAISYSTTLTNIGGSAPTYSLFIRVTAL